MSADRRDTNHDGKVSLMEKVKDKLHPHKNAEHTTTGYTNSTTHHTSGLASAAPMAAAVPIIGTAAIPLAGGALAGAAPLSGAHDSRDLNRDGHVSTSERLASGATGIHSGGAYDSRDLNRDGHISTGERLASGATGMHSSGMGVHDSRDLNRDGHISTSERLASGATGMHSSGMHGSGMGAYDSRDLNRDGHISTSEQLASGLANTHLSEDARLRLHEEQLAISKREVGAGEVDIHKRVIEQHVQQTVPVRREEITVERRPLTGAASPNARIAAQDETMRVPLFREEIITEKRIVPTEEVIVRKKEVIDQQTVGATLRSEYVETFQTGTHSSSAMNGAMLNGTHDARDTNFDGQLSAAERAKAALGPSHGAFGDARDTNRDGHVSLGEKAKAGIAPAHNSYGDARDINRDGHVSMGEKAQAAVAPSKGAFDARDSNRDGHVSMGEKLKSARG